MPSVQSVSPGRSFAEILPDYGFADGLQVRTAELHLTARAAAERAFRENPAWIKALMTLRNRLVRLAGLKSSLKDIKPANAGLIGWFPIVSETPERIVLGFDDKHLDFRIVVDAQPEPGSTSVILATLVRTHNFWGRTYLAGVMPFHKMITRSCAARIGTPPSDSDRT